MSTYRRLKGNSREGRIVIRIVDHGEVEKAFVLDERNPDDPADHKIFPSEEMSPEEAFRVVESRRDQIGDAEVFVEMEVGVEWNDAWGTLTDADASKS